MHITQDARLPATLVFDFDSTIINDETLDVLAEHIARERGHTTREKRELREQIAHITDMGMNGEIDVRESFARRFALLHPDKNHIQELAVQLPALLAPSVHTHRDFFALHNEQIYVVSGSFREEILPTTRMLGILDSHVFGNIVLYNERDIATGVDPRIPTSHSGGKADVIEAIRNTTPHITLPIVMIGDGMSDAKAKKPGVAADLFWVYTEAISRDHVVPLADKQCKDMGEVIAALVTV